MKPSIDENAASHIAVGQAYSQNMEGTAEMSAEQKLAARNEHLVGPCGLDDWLWRT